MAWLWSRGVYAWRGMMHEPCRDCGSSPPLRPLFCLFSDNGIDDLNLERAASSLALMTTPLDIRPPAVAGAFYAGSTEQLSREVEHLLHGAQPVPADAALPKAVIAPHAGYVYSGPIAANAYARFASARGRIKRVVLLGPAHRVAFDGLALPGVSGMQTPLGVVPVDSAGAQAISDLPQVVVSAQAHTREHSLEVHLPLLQAVLGEFSVVPLVVGNASPRTVAEVLDRLWGGDETLIVISSDLSHYLAYDQAQAIDRDTIATILAKKPTLDHHRACGATPVNGLLTVAQRRGLTPKLFDLRNSGDTAGDRSRVVGYASVGFFAGDTATGRTDDEAAADDRGEILIPIARAAIGGILGVECAADESHPFLREHAATFVTLNRQGRLRGCIGTLQAHRPLLDDLKHNAKAAAFLDPRFQPLTHTEFATTQVEVSILSEPHSMPVRDEADALAQLRPHIDGLIFQHGSRRSTFLPQVWESIPDPAQFLRQLKMKAGLDANFWAADVKLWRYDVVKYRDTN
jgi:AmmeMemoRadiSam system protein B/AmmeMemoRadiSam system protein A